MMCDNQTPHCCPVCHGQGTVSKPPHVAGDITSWSSSDTKLYECPACKGTGIVWGPPDTSGVQQTKE